MVILKTTQAALVAVSAWASTAGSALAQTAPTSGFWSTWWSRWTGWGDTTGTNYSQVPEIDAGAGLLAIAAILAAAALTFELRRRRRGKSA